MARDISSILKQTKIPVIYRPENVGSVMVKLPYANNNKDWLRNEKRSKPHWISTSKYWRIPRAWFNDTVERCLHRFGKVYVIQPYREQEKCSPACMNAKGHECQCSCMGANHGQGEGGSWFVVSDTFATRRGEKDIACRLMKV